MRVVLCVDGGAPGQLLHAALQLVSTGASWAPVHVIDTRGRVDLGLLRAGVPGSGSLGANQRALIETAGREHARTVVEPPKTRLRARPAAAPRARRSGCPRGCRRGPGGTSRPPVVRMSSACGLVAPCSQIPHPFRPWRGQAAFRGTPSMVRSPAPAVHFTPLLLGTARLDTRPNSCPTT